MTGNKKAVQFIPMAITAILILATGIIFKQPVFVMLPLFVSLVVNYLQSKVSRTAYLLGGLNSLIYAAIYFFFLKLYASAASAVLVSFTMQIATYILWKRKPAGKATVFKKFTGAQRAGLAVIFVIVWLVVYFVISKTDANNSFLDVTSTVFGTFVTIIIVFAYIEYAPLMIVSALLSLVLNCKIALEQPEYITYIIYSLYCLYCQIKACVNVRQLWILQEGCKNEVARI